MAVEDAASNADLQQRLAQAERELAEAREGEARLRRELADARERETEGLARETASAEILRVIASSPTDLRPVLGAVAKNAARLCECDNVSIFRVEGERLRKVADDGLPAGTGMGGAIPITPESSPRAIPR